MFESVLGRGVGAPGRPAAGAAISLGLHAFLLALAIVMSRPAPAPLPLPTISFPRFLPRGPAAAQGGPRAQASSQRRPPSALKPQSVQPSAPTPRTKVEDAPAVEGPGVSSGGTGTDVEACPSPPCSPAGRPGGDGPVPLLGPQMVPPRLLSGPEPRYSAEAGLEHVGGTVLARCTVTDRGSVEDCVVMKSVPLLDAAVLSALAARRYAPALFEGRPLSVRVVIPVRFVPP
jgi:periplasmic protein TonB